MEKLYPPSIESKIPAFTNNILKIPFNMNKAVGINEVKGMSVLIKTIQTGEEIGIVRGIINQDLQTKQYYSEFSLGEDIIKKLNIQQYYKVQLAYIDYTDEVGYYSTVGVIKYTTKPKVTIPQLEDKVNSQYEYTGKYDQSEGDESERIYSYCFELTDENENIIATSGVQLHNSEKDEMFKPTVDTWINRIELPIDQPHFLTYKTTSVNGLEVSSRRYKVMNQDSIDITIPLNVISELNYDDGSIKLYLKLEKENDIIPEINHYVMITRSSSVDGFKEWDEIYKSFYTNDKFNQSNKILIWEDYNIQQGIEYQYGLQFFNIYGIYSNKKLSQIINADFEDAFLLDGDRQLKIRFNPKVASFKNTILESKMDTIGGKYPFIFRNGNVYYKEFSISGLISLIADPNEKFLSGIQQKTNFSSQRNETATIDKSNYEFDTLLTSNNIKRERTFKMEVLEWLNNGKPKVFKSPTEGNYIIRLMNVSLSPNDTLGRMLHTFNSTAYEIAEYNFQNLYNLNLINLPTYSGLNVKVGQINCSDIINTFDDEDFGIKYPHIINKDELRKLYPNYSTFMNIVHECIGFNIKIYNASITEALPGTVIRVLFEDGSHQDITIGITGSYYFQNDEPHIIAIGLAKTEERPAWYPHTKFSFLYYKEDTNDLFNLITNIDLSDEIRQIIGPNINNNLVGLYQDLFVDSRRELGTFIYMKITKRPVQTVWTNNPVEEGKLFTGNLYKHKEWMDNEEPIQIQQDMIYYIIDSNMYLFGDTKIPTSTKPDFRFALNSKEKCPQCGNLMSKCTCKNNLKFYNDFIDFEGRTENSIDDYTDGTSFGRVEAIRNIKKVESLHAGNGLILDIIYRVRTKTYAVNNRNSALAWAKKAWERSIKENDSLNNIEFYYKTYVNELNKELKIQGGY